MKLPGILLTLLLATAASLYGNGGGYYRGGVQQAGDVAGFEPESTEKIRILNEKLTVKLGVKEAGVDIRYLMRNETDKEVKVRFGFPVEESRDELMLEEQENVPKDDGKLKYCKGYQIAASGKSIDAKWQGEEKPATDDSEFKGIEGWLISEITFAAGEEIPVTIQFRSEYPSGEWGVSDDNSVEPAIFKYRLSTAACWAGTIGTGKIVLKPDGIEPSELKVLKPVNRFQKTGDDWVWEFENLEPALADDLQIEARPRINSYANGEYTERGGKWTMAHTNYAVTASSTLAKKGGTDYSANNLKDTLSIEKAWCEGAPGPGIGEWLELKPEVPKPLVAIRLYPGYWKTTGEDPETELFFANARPRSILVELNGSYQFTAAVPDAREECEIPIPAAYTEPVSKLKLTFKEAWSGKQYEDLCISGIRLQVGLDKKPKLTPSR